MKKSNFIWVILLAAAVSALAGCDKATAASANGNGAAARVPEVEVVQVKLEERLWTQTYPARVEGSRKVQVRPRVSGIIVKRSYAEGALVKEGDELFLIDPVPYRLAADKARADLARADAQLAQAERDWKRVEKLFASGSVSEKQRDDALSARDIAKANRGIAQSALEQAELNLGYTSVTSPVSGVTSMEVFNEGSLVSSADILTTVTQQDPIHVKFSLPEGDPAYQQLFANGFRHKEGSKALTLFTRSGDKYGRSGQVNFLETGVDPATASVRLRAEFDNPDAQLLDGQFARVAFEDLKLTLSALIPEAAVIMSPHGPLVYVVGENGTVQVRPVRLGPVLEEGQLVTGGLADGDRVIITSLIRLKPGAPVSARVKGEATH